MYQEICKPTDNYYTHLKKLFQARRYDDMLSLVTGITPTSPYYTISKAWEIVTTGKISDSSGLGELIDYDRDIMVFDTGQGEILSKRDDLDNETRRIWHSMECIKPDSRMPYRKGKKTRDIFEDESFNTETIFEVFSTCFAAFVCHIRQDAVLRSSKNAYLQGWQNVVAPTGSLGAHFHPGAWISLVYYPPRDGIVKNNNSSIVFGCYPEEMGGGDGIMKLEVEAKVGRIIVFPAFMGHAVREQNANASRVSLAADIRFAYTQQDLTEHAVLHTS
ncbi:MAG: hypothetical protein DHS20C01_31970 [marine bacterium B5-7]|nr:MAG: hypothetical protein DHS20C01_31970 [marine bacterium B5-7]